MRPYRFGASRRIRPDPLNLCSLRGKGEVERSQGIDARGPKNEGHRPEKQLSRRGASNFPRTSGAPDGGEEKTPRPGSSCRCCLAFVRERKFDFIRKMMPDQ